MAPGDRKQAKLAVVGPGMVERDDRIANSSGTAKARAAEAWKTLPYVFDPNGTNAKEQGRGVESSSAKEESGTSGHGAPVQTRRAASGSPSLTDERSDAMTDLPRKILLATAGTPASDPELRAAADLSARTGAPVRVVHVGRDLPAPSHYGPDYNLFANDAEADREASRLANAQAAMIEERGGTVAEVYSQPGKRPGDEIVKNTRDEDVGLVVVGERGMGPFRYGSRTSITATVVREAFCPVLVVRGWTAGLDQEGFDQGRFPRRVLLATDGTPNAAPAAQKAVEISRGTGSELHVAHVEARGAEEGRSREVLDGEVGRIEGTGGNVAASHLLRGHPAAEIQRLAEGVGAELLVVGGRVSGPEVGPRAAASTSRSIVEGSELPVLVVRGDRPSRPLVEAPVCQHMLNR